MLDRDELIAFFGSDMDGSVGVDGSKLMDELDDDNNGKVSYKEWVEHFMLIETRDGQDQLNVMIIDMEQRCDALVKIQCGARGMLARKKAKQLAFSRGV